LSYRDAWPGSISSTHPATPAESAVAWTSGLGLPLLAIALAVFCFVKKRDVNPLAAALPLAALAGWLALTMDSRAAGALLFNAYALALGIGTLVRGVRRERISSANAGMVVIAALVVSRFFDSDFSFLARGIAFIAVGIGFLVANFLLFKRRKVQT